VSSISRLAAMWVCLIALAAACTGSQATPTAPVAQVAVPFDAEIAVASPDGQLRIELGRDQLSRPRYRVIGTVNGADHVVVNDSTLGVETSRSSLTTTEQLVAVGSAVLVTDEFVLPHGKARAASIEARTQTVRADGFEVDLWIADTAAAFRYRIDGDDGQVTVEWERTSFAMAPDSNVWLQPNDPPTRFTPAYEQAWSRVTTAANPRPTTHGWVFPGLFQTEQHWVLITETALASGAAGSHFSPATTNGEFLLDLPDRGEGNGLGDARPVATNGEGWTSPWRLIVASPDLGDIVESNHVRHLSPPAPDDSDFTWVEPGTVSWSWWSDHASSRTAADIEPFIDMASELGWPYSLVDANWNLDAETFGEERLEDLVAYAAERDVELFVWYNSGGPNNAVTEAPRDRMATADTRRAEFAWLNQIGVAGVKVDFFHSDKPTTIQQYRDILSDAADFALMVNFHGATLPRGWQREFPNLMTVEAVRGAEFYTFFNAPTYARSQPRINAVLPFTRNVVGPMDFTPGVLGDQFNRRTTNGHELALSVVFESALLHLVDTPEVYLSQPPQVLDLLETVPAAWDETRFVDGFPGSHAVIARRDGTTWWIGAISALNDPRTVQVDLSGLGVAPGVPVVSVCDDGDDTGQNYQFAAEPASGELALTLAPDGGCLVRIG